MRLAISSYERPRIVAAVADRHLWEETKRGFGLSLLRVPDKTLPVAWSVRYKGQTLCGLAPTVTAAIECVNGIVQAGHGQFLRATQTPVTGQQIALFGSH